MNIAPGAIATGPPVDAPEPASPPGSRPGEFDEVLGAELGRLERTEPRTSTRTADAEGARDNAGEMPDEGSADGFPGDEAQQNVAADQTVPRATPLTHQPIASPDEPAAVAAVVTVDPVGELPLPIPLKPQTAALPLPAQPPAPSTTAAEAPAPGPAGQLATAPVATGAEVLPSGLPAAALPNDHLPPPAHPTATVEDGLTPADRAPVRAPASIDTEAIEKLDELRPSPQVQRTPARAELQPVDSQPQRPSRADVQESSETTHPAQSHRGVAGTTGQTGTSTSSEGGPGLHRGDAQNAAPAQLAAAQESVPRDAVVTAAKAEIPVRARARMSELADVAGTVIRLAARDGKSTARITLRPVELGEVEIRLRYHAGGVTADVVTESRQAAQLLQNASSELRRSLESQGLTVHWLDVRAGAEERRGWGELGSSPDGRHADRDEADEDSTTTIEASSLPVAAGGVDVLA